MAKGKNWTQEEMQEMESLIWSGKNLKEVAVLMGRSYNAVKIKRLRFDLPKMCEKCTGVMDNERGKKYCTKCVAKNKKEFQEKWYSENKKRYKNYRYEKYRYGGNYIKALERDKRCCVECAMSNEQHIEKRGCSITVDHIDGRGRNAKEQNNNLENLQTMCLTCHGKKDTRRTSHYIKAHNNPQETTKHHRFTLPLVSDAIG